MTPRQRNSERRQLHRSEPHRPGKYEYQNQRRDFEFKGVHEIENEG